jgi:Putative Ig domain
MVRFRAAQNWVGGPVDLSIDDVMISGGALHQVLITEAASGTPNPSTTGGAVQCHIGAADTWGFPLFYRWSSSGGIFQDTGTNSSTNAAPTWSAANGGEYTITATVFCTNAPAATNQSSFVQHVGGNSPPAILTSSPLPRGALGATYSQTLQVTGGVPPYSWAVVSGSLPPGLILAINSGTISGTPTATSTFSFRVRVTDAGGLYSESDFSLVITPAALVTATHSTGSYFSPGTNTVVCQVTYPLGRQLYLLLWTPQLPAGWSLLGASGDGNPEVSAGDIVFAGASLPNPLNFTYTVSISTNQAGTNLLRGAVTYLLDGMRDTVTLMATPDPLPVTRILYHSADYRDPRWIIDNLECSWVLAYWRAQGYHVSVNDRDGYAPGSDNTNGPRHSADYRSPYWVIDGTEMSRVLSYWRAGGYHPDPAGLDGYGPGKPGPTFRTDPKSLDIIVTQQGPVVYAPGGTLQLTNIIQYSRPLLSLLVRPRLPAGWTLQSVSGDGNPEELAGEILWTGVIPPSPIQLVCTVQTPAGDRSPQPLRSEVEYQMNDMVNAQLCYAEPDPLILGTVKLLPAAVRDRQIELIVAGEPGATYRIQASTNLVDWTEAGTVTLVSSPTSVREGMAGPYCFFRVLLAP